ncbi:MAG: PSD1 and planctomycete cytochrome C domain-containing protein [Bryobacterales bacterium]|nr:PSD1 and planctomycete cytochrome C domain-containing protein [Bryobacteraceae bacterium]MDW8353486.1 PSD1 and planctomycete cytochrome C domain-containing protein [Bryobacterales bacterium]
MALCAPAAASSPEEFFESRIRPLLSRHCYSCHTTLASGGLRLDSRSALLKGGARGPAIVPGNPEQSLLIRVVQYQDERIKMPPAKKLDEEEIADLIRWVREGAVWGAETVPTGNPGSENAASFWSFRPPQAPSLPRAVPREWAANPVDRFIFAKLRELGLKPAPLADKRTLIRRATYDLTGLPPSPEEVEAFLRDRSPNAFEKVVDRLLASPHYGERWGRRWLDLVRYADTAGDSADYPIPQARLYRDYVIASFNRDKPYDQFLREQIAGDLLPYRDEEDRWEKIVATGYIAISRRFSVRPERNMHLTIEDTLDNLGKVVLGLSISCARCHDHKYDPISAKDYYALYGIFASTRYPFAGSENDPYQKDLIYRLPQEKVDEILKPYREQLAAIDAEIARLEEERKALGPAGTSGTPGGRTAQDITADIRRASKRRAEVLASMPPLETAFAVAEGTPQNVRVHLRGDPRTLGEEVPRGFLKVLGGGPLPKECKGSGRLELAQWLTDANNPLTARVMVNRIWQHHFGRGLVATANDFGKRGSRPTHPELLDYLALRFQREGWSVKAMHRLIMLSRTYQLSSAPPAGSLEKDPNNEYLSRFPRRRLEAEEIRDSLLVFSGALERGTPGPHPFPPPSSWNFTQHKPFTAVYDNHYRSVYMMTQRIQKHPYLALFDGPDPNLSTPVRGATTTPLQALFFLNSEFVHIHTERFAKSLLESVPDIEGRIDRAHRIVLARPAARDELRTAVEYLARAAQKLAATGVSEPLRRQAALASYLRALVSSNEFLFVD